MERASREVWAKRVGRWKRSGLTSAEFGAREGFNGQTLKFWKWKLGKDRRRPASRMRPKPSFVELSAPIPVPPVSSKFEVDVGARRVRFESSFDAAALSRVLDVLEARR